ncbi:MAG: hypothetical protein ACOVP8_05990, partial [Phycisphaerales bacterium]
MSGASTFVGSAQSGAVLDVTAAGACPAPATVRRAVLANPVHLDATVGVSHVFVGAEGASSQTRLDFFATPVQTQDGLNVDLNDNFAPIPCRRRHGGAFRSPFFIEADGNNPAHGGIITAGFVLRGVCPALNDVAGGQGVVAGAVYRKNFAPGDGHEGRCQIELRLKNEPGITIARAMSLQPTNANVNTCSFNWNLQAPNKLDGANFYRNQLVLMHRLLALTSQNIDRDFGNVLEFKFWDNHLRVSTSQAIRAAVTAGAGQVLDEPAQGVNPTSAFVSKVYTDAAGAPHLIALVGDAVREALPDSGMGVNDGHAMAKRLGVSIASLIPHLADNVALAQAMANCYTNADV